MCWRHAKGYGSVPKYTYIVLLFFWSFNWIFNYTYYNKLFTFEKEKRRRWVFGKRKIRQLAPLSAQPSSRETLQSEAEEERRLDGAEFVRLTSTPRSTHQSEEENRSISAVEIQPNAPHQHQRKNEDLAATKIQTAFRGYLVSIFKTNHLAFFFFFSILVGNQVNYKLCFVHWQFCADSRNCF